MFNSPSLQEITVQELAQQITVNGDNLQLIDVREPQEISLATIPGFTVLPLSQFAQWSSNITTYFDINAETIVLCHHGIRSAQMCQWLADRGFTNLKNVSGGIDAYSRKVDRNIPRY